MQDLESIYVTHGKVDKLVIDDEFVTHMANEKRQFSKHAVSEKEVYQAHSKAPKYFENKGVKKRAPVILVGSTDDGRIIVVPIEPTHIKGVWHPITAFEANTHDIKRYESED